MTTSSASTSRRWTPSARRSSRCPGPTPDPVPETVTIPGRFNGPPASANGGYTCGLVAGLVGTEEVSVSLRLPPPVETPLRVVRDGDGVELRDDDALVAEGAPAQLLLDVPDAISPDEAGAASRGWRDRWC